MDDFIVPMIFGGFSLFLYAIAKKKIVVVILAVLLMVIGCVRFKVLIDIDELQRKRYKIESDYSCYLTDKKFPDPLHSPFGETHWPDNCREIFCDCPIRGIDLKNAEMEICPCGHSASSHASY